MRKRRASFGIAALLAVIAFALPPEAGATGWAPTGLPTQTDLGAGPEEGPATRDAFAGMPWTRHEASNTPERLTVRQNRQKTGIDATPRETVSYTAIHLQWMRHAKERRRGYALARSGPSDDTADEAADLIAESIENPMRSSVMPAAREPVEDDPRRS
jgi:hypothetical protein